MLILQFNIKVGQDDLTRRNEFKALSDGQKDAITQVLGKLQVVSKDVATSIKASETVLAARLTSQDAQLEQSMRMLSTDIPATVQGSEARLMNRFDGQESLLKDAAQKQGVQTEYLQDQAHDALRTRLLDALAFPEMNERRNMIEQRVGDFGETYGWIFGPTDDDEPNDDDEDRFHPGRSHAFVEWLRTGQEIFWISGKPGSGKSSLMGFIYRNLQPGRRAFAHLEAWANPQPVRILSFWFFRPATRVLLKSLEGFWRSLCFQILGMDKDIVTKIQADVDNAAPDSLRACLVKPGSHAQSWTNIELKSWLHYLLDHSTFNYCLVVDGLDEVPNEREALLDAIRVIAQSSNKIKICCSSRPENLFQRALEQYPFLRLQDFNYGDIMSHCRKHLSTTRAASFTERIARRADGVFLWAYLVVKELSTAAYLDDLEELEQRLEECPSEMNELFIFLIERQDKFYAKHPKPYLRLIDVATRKGMEASLLDVLVASQEQERLSCNFPDNLDAQFLTSLNAVAENFEASVVARCAGLVEFIEQSTDSAHNPFFPETFAHKALARVKKLEAHFIHRSAQDFLVDSESGAALLRSCNISEQEAFRRLMTASAVIFFLNDNHETPFRILEAAEEIDWALWTEFDTIVIDHALVTSQKRRPLALPPSLSGDEVENRRLAKVQPRFGIICPHLSPLKNVVFTYAVTWGLTRYLEAKLSMLGMEELTLVSGFYASLLFDYTVDVHRKADYDLLAIFKPHISWTQNLTLYHFWRQDYCYVRVTRPFWQQFRLDSLYEASSSSILGALQQRGDRVGWILSGIEGEAPGLRAWLIFDNGMEWTIYPEPDEPDEPLASTMNAMADSCDILRFHITLQAGPPSVQFLQCSPAGLDRFLEIGASTSESLQQIILESHPEFTVGKHMAGFLNHHIASLSAVEIARVVFAHRSREYHSIYGNNAYIFSQGRIYNVLVSERESWEERLLSGIFCEDFETDPEHDPVLNEILKILQEYRNKRARG
ncbi:uncharacterized protein PV07_08919 [Cladophialophora immunda]|uniref:NACHT domain-containing protein n=1 Tax=Cladophialophora immunda TaxID=569365 RepID=A0A0D2C5K3_9EURO|nr:uncharacterized protein PV07_08919 [Cladophialophora immunda]KIW25765.1 hypothetical protein PV07_08919 [Cladophialophora immunda]